VPPRPHPVILVALAVACFVVAFLVAPRTALPSTSPGSAAYGVGSGTPVHGTRSASSARAPVDSTHSASPARAPAAYAVGSASPARAPAAYAVGSATPARAPAVRSPSSPRATWRWPLRGRVVGAFRLTPQAPFARGQRRGIDVAAAPGATVRAACPGPVTFAGPLPHAGLAVTVRCSLVATYLRLGALAVRHGARVAVGQRLGALGPDGRLRLGARRAGDRRGYVDPLDLLRDPAPTAPPDLGPAPPPRPPRPAPIPPARPRSAPPLARAKPRSLPWPAYPALALIATALPVGSLVHRRRRRATTAVAAAHERA
jgi:Peptidase family M23